MTDQVGLSDVNDLQDGLDDVVDSGASSSDDVNDLQDEVVDASASSSDDVVDSGASSSDDVNDLQDEVVDASASSSDDVVDSGSSSSDDVNDLQDDVVDASASSSDDVVDSGSSSSDDVNDLQDDVVDASASSSDDVVPANEETLPTLDAMNDFPLPVNEVDFPWNSMGPYDSVFLNEEEPKDDICTTTELKENKVAVVSDTKATTNHRHFGWRQQTIAATTNHRDFGWQQQTIAATTNHCINNKPPLFWMATTVYFVLRLSLKPWTLLFNPAGKQAIVKEECGKANLAEMKKDNTLLPSDDDTYLVVPANDGILPTGDVMNDFPLPVNEVDFPWNSMGPYDRVPHNKEKPKDLHDNKAAEVLETESNNKPPSFWMAATVQLVSRLVLVPLTLLFNPFGKREIVKEERGKEECRIFVALQKGGKVVFLEHAPEEEDVKESMNDNFVFPVIDDPLSKSLLDARVSSSARLDEAELLRCILDVRLSLRILRNEQTTVSDFDGKAVCVFLLSCTRVTSKSSTTIEDLYDAFVEYNANNMLMSINALFTPEKMSEVLGYLNLRPSNLILSKTSVHFLPKIFETVLEEASYMHRQLYARRLNTLRPSYDPTPSTWPLSIWMGSCGNLRDPVMSSFRW